MFLERKESLSLVYLIKDLFSGTSYVNVVDEFPEDQLTLPTIAIDIDTIELVPFEIGNREGRRIRRWFIDIFANTKSQRDEIGYKILNELKNGIVVYNYDEGFPPDVTPSIESHLGIVSRRMKVIKVFSELVEKMYYRATIEIVATNDVTN